MSKSWHELSNIGASVRKKLENCIDIGTCMLASIICAQAWSIKFNGKFHRTSVCFNCKLRKNENQQIIYFPRKELVIDEILQIYIQNNLNGLKLSTLLQTFNFQCTQSSIWVFFSFAYTEICAENITNRRNWFPSEIKYARNEFLNLPFR